MDKPTMDESNFAPMYNLKAVVKETGLKPDTLRAWERRYGLPEPRRTPSGHRLYSERDITILKWLINRQAEGLSISRAIALWHQITEEGKDPVLLDDTLQESSRNTAQPALNVSASGAPPADTEIVDQLRQRWIFACLAFDEQQAEQVLEESFSLFSVEKVCFHLLQQGLAEMGAGWLQGTITPQQEHFASSLAMRRLQSLLTATPPPHKTERILVGCPPQETHTFTPLLLTLLLRRRGWNSIYLGANIPIENMRETVANTHPKLVVLGAQQLYTAATLLEIASELVYSQVPVAFGGRVFTQNKVLQDRIPGHFLGDDIDSAIHSIEKILHMPKRDQIGMYSANQFNNEAAISFQEQHLQIESHVVRSVETMNIDRGFLTAANASLGRTIRAILLLRIETADIGTIGAQELLNTLPSRYPVSHSKISLYLSAYADAVQKFLQEEAETIAQWLYKSESADILSGSTL